MRRGCPDDRTLRLAITLAVRAPSVHNSQPWRWRVGGRSVHLYADWSRHLPATDPDGRDLVVSCGAALHHLRVALAALGWGATVHRLPNPNDRDHLASVELSPRQPSHDDITLVSAVPRRRSDRRLYSSWPVSDALLDQLRTHSTEEASLLRAATDPATRSRLLLALAEARRTQESDDDYCWEVAAWSGRYAGDPDGVPAGAAPADQDGYGGLPLRRFVAPLLTQPPGALTDPDGGTLVVLGTGSDDLRSRLHAGEAASVVLLRATSFGLATCPLSQPLEVPETRAAIRSLLGGQAFPQLMLRIGWAHLNADPLPATPRRPVGQVISRLDGGPDGVVADPRTPTTW
ncbi:Acg family FMN-binding oxidoreductase [Goodfellowiella coeruleoviolacea]|uniref:Nitroreductase family protein n=1 Tax=Goodfellowiella coeruleoviolacea TaxID=334858 RepID=A0AAE3GL40_9PSEU|nr:NAD(P)H nitroreductase [Goodfellowiella coeruleoviolacea]MCP2170171.1 Nitroreductase family protein [Goodfellowiella coeruleoviolacea]